MTDNPLAPALDAIAARLKADAERIAELEAELAALIPVAGACPECGIDPEELAALNGRRCETCQHRKAEMSDFGYINDVCPPDRVLDNEPGDVFMYEAEKQTEQAIYLLLEDIAARLVEQAAKTVSEVAERLAPISREPGVKDQDKCVQGVPQELWPPHFSTMRGRLASIQSSLVDIRSLLDGTGL